MHPATSNTCRDCGGAMLPCDLPEHLRGALPAGVRHESCERCDQCGKLTVRVAAATVGIVPAPACPLPMWHVGARYRHDHGAPGGRNPARERQPEARDARKASTRARRPEPVLVEHVSARERAFRYHEQQLAIEAERWRKEGER